MEINNKFDIGEEVVFHAEPEKKSVFVKSFLVSQGELVYGLTGIDGWHFDFEIGKSKTTTEKKSIGFTPPHQKLKKRK